MDDAVQDYIDAIDPAHRPLFDRLHRLILEVHPDATIGLSHKMPTHRVGRRRLRSSKTSKGTIQLRPADAVNIPDDDVRDLIPTV